MFEIFEMFMNQFSDRGQQIILGIIFLSVGGIFFLIAAKILQSVERAKFYRRNAAGVEEFENFDAAARANNIEVGKGCLAQIVAGIGSVFFLIGTVLLLVALFLK